MDKEYFIKIIIPNYNNYIYIKKCLDSILEQTFKDWFCIIVDDQSTDNSDRIAEIYESRYPDKFKLIRMDRKEYAGGCRNRGLSLNIKSKYTYFIDSDDQLFNKDSLQQIFNASTNNPDLIECKVIEEKNLKQTLHKQFNNIRDILFDGVQPCKHCINSKFDNIEFISNRAKSNDLVWGIRIFDAIDNNRISFTEKPVYLYRLDSLTSCQHAKTIKNNINCTDAQFKLINDLRNEQYKKSFCNEFRDLNIRKFEKYFSIYGKRISIEEAFRNSYVISIDKNKLNIFYNIFKKQFNGIELPKFHQGSCDKRLTGPQNCTRSHLDIVRKARYLNLPFVMIFEDDAYPCFDAYETFSRYLNFIPNDAKLILLGWSNHSQLRDFSKRTQSFGNFINRIQTIISGSHSYILFKSAYDEYINFFSNRPKATADCHIFYSIQPSYILNYPLFIQYSGSKSMNNHIGYIYYGNHDEPPTNFPKIDYYNI